MLVARGMKVTWVLLTGGVQFGTVISDEVNGFVQVAVESMGEMKYVIWAPTASLNAPLVQGPVPVP